MDCNRVVLCGRVAAIEALRYTPAGIPIVNFRISHASERMEAGMKRRVECEVAAVALGEFARNAARLQVGDPVALEGFLGRRSLRSTQLVLHVSGLNTNFETR